VRLPRLQVLLVSPNAGKSRARLNLGPAVYSLDLGFRDFLISGKAALLELGRAIARNLSPERVGDEVGNFATQVKGAATSQATLDALPEFQAFGKLLSSPSQSERVRGINQLGSTAHPALVEPFANLLKLDPSESVRAAAASVLIRLGSSESLEAATAALSDASQSVQLETVLGLLKRGDPKINESLLAHSAGLCAAARRILDADRGQKVEEAATPRATVRSS
jgi:hypothetical protein